jgi:hypothetical protein
MTTPAGSRTTYQMPSSPWASGLAIFAGAMLATLGVFQFLQGLAGVLDDKVFVSTPDYVVSFDLTTWGWIHIVIGIVAALVGGAILADQSWGYALGIVVAVVSALGSFAFMPYYPLWGMVLLAFDIAVIWALSSLIGSRR